MATSLLIKKDKREPSGLLRSIFMVKLKPYRARTNVDINAFIVNWVTVWTVRWFERWGRFNYEKSWTFLDNITT